VRIVGGVRCPIVGGEYVLGDTLLSRSLSSFPSDMLMIRKLGAGVLLTGALVACESPSDGGTGQARVRLEVDSVAPGQREVAWKARVMDGRDLGVPGTMVRFSFWYPPTGAVTVDSARTDAEGYAQVRFNAPTYGMLNVRADIGAGTRMDSAVARVRVYQKVAITTLTVPYTELDSLSLNGPQCSSSTYIRSEAVTYTVQDTAVAAILNSGLGGTAGIAARRVLARLPGTTRVIATGAFGGADTLLLKVSAPAEPGQFLRRMPANRPIMAGIGPDSVVIARGDSTSITLSTDPFDCDAAMLPANFVVSIQSANSSVVQIEAAESKRWTAVETGYQASAGVNARLRGVAVGRTEVVATAPYIAPRRLTVIVR
jgi:hypothetical protein